MSVDGVVLAGRAAAASLMIDTCTVIRGAGQPTYDAGSDSYVSSPGQLLYTGPCRVKPRDDADRVVEAGGDDVSLFPYVVWVLLSSVAYDVDDTVTVTASALDPALVGLKLRVRRPILGSQMTARRLGCEVQS